MDVVTSEMSLNPSKKNEYTYRHHIHNQAQQHQQIYENYFYNNNLDKQLSFSNFKVTVRKLHDCGWKNSSHKSADVALLGYGCVVSKYPQFFEKDSKTFQMLPRPYIRSFDEQCYDKVLKQKWVLDMSNRAETFVLESIESRIMSDD